MKLNESAAWGWWTAGVCLGFFGLECVKESVFWGGALPVIGAVWCGCRAGASEERSPLAEALPTDRSFTCRTKDGKIISLESTP